jgi:pimeloyl-ACP methyl ester carboxylesterase
MTNADRMNGSTRAAALVAEADTRLVDVGGRRLAVSCSGRGAPTVVLETGLGAESDAWLPVQRGVEQFSRVCRYDRAGRGGSDPASPPRSAGDMVRDLHTLLSEAGIPGPYILVGHSFGGLLVRLYAHRYRSEVLGLILVDSMHEDQFDVFGPTFLPPSPHEPQALKDTRTFWTTGWRNPGSTTEGIDFPTSLAQAREIASLGDIPLHVLTAGTFLNQPLVPPDRRVGLQQLWDGLQARFEHLSSNANRTIVKTSGHFIQREQPRVVIDAVRQMITQLQPQ